MLGEVGYLLVINTVIVSLLTKFFFAQNAYAVYLNSKWNL